MTDIQKQLAFLCEIDKMKNELRRTLILDGSRRENDAEHSWHVAVMAMIFAPYASPETNVPRAVQMLLIHDLVEIYAGDTFAYDEKGNATKAERETKSADKLFSMLPEPQGAELRAMWEEFDRMDTPDSAFAAALDRFQPMLSNFSTSGHTWTTGVTHSQVLHRAEPIKKYLPELWVECEKMITLSVSYGWITEDLK